MVLLEVRQLSEAGGGTKPIIFLYALRYLAPFAVCKYVPIRASQLDASPSVDIRFNLCH